MGSAHSAVAFDDTVTTTFGECLAWGAIGTIGSQCLAWSAVRTIGSQCLTWGAVGTISGENLALWRFVITVFSDQAFFFQAIIATFGKGLALWSAVGTIGSDGLAEHRAAVFDLWSGLVSSRQSESGAGQH